MYSYTVIATSATSPKSSDLAVGISTALVTPLVGMLGMIPSFLVAVLGTFVRSQFASSRASSTE